LENNSPDAIRFQNKTKEKETKSSKLERYCFITIITYIHINYANRFANRLQEQEKEQEQFANQFANRLQEQEKEQEQDRNGHQREYRSRTAFKQQVLPVLLCFYLHEQYIF